MIARRVVLAAWDVVVLAALAVYAGQFVRLPAQSAAFPRLIAYPVAAFALASLGGEVFGLFRARAVGRTVGAAPRASGADTAGRPALPAAQRGPASGAGAPPVRGMQLLLGIALGIIYLLLWTPLGFELDTAVFLTATPALLGQPLRRLPMHALIAVVTAVLFTFLFQLGSGAILPAGALGLKWP